MEIQSTDIDTAELMHRIRAKVENKMKNFEYKADVELINSLGSAITIKRRLEDGFFLLDNLSVLSTSKKGFFGKIVRFIAKRIYWIFYHSLAPVFTVQQDFNREIYTQLKTLQKKVDSVSLEVETKEKQENN